MLPQKYVPLHVLCVLLNIVCFYISKCLVYSFFPTRRPTICSKTSKIKAQYMLFQTLISSVLCLCS